MTRPRLAERFATASALALLAALAFESSAFADRLVTTDGRVLTLHRAKKLDDGSYELEFANGTIICPEKWIASVEVEGDMSDYVPQNDTERKNLEKGFVRYQGKWMSKPAYEAQLKREAEAARERVAELAKHSEFMNAYSMESKHFQIRTNTSPELLEYYAELLEAYYDLIDRELGIKPTPTLRKVKMNVNIYKNAEDYYEATDMPRGAVGYFWSVDQSLNFFHDYEDPSFTEWVALHECMHLLTYLIEPQAQPQIWVNEAIADYFGSSTILLDKRGRLEIEPGALQLDRVLTVQRAIEDNDYIPLEKLFFWPRDSYGAVQYAHGWSFVYFLNNTPEYQKGFKKFFSDFYTIGKNVDYEWSPGGTWKIIPPQNVQDLLLKHLKVKDLAELEKEWIEFMKGIQIDAPEALFKRAYRNVRLGDVAKFEESAKDLDAAISAGFDDPRAFWARGLVAAWLGKGGIKGGVEDLRTACEMSPLNALFRYSLGQSLSGYSISIGGTRISVSDESGESLLFGTPEEIEEAGVQLGLASELAPDNDRFREAAEDYLRRLEGYDPGAADDSGD